MKIYQQQIIRCLGQQYKGESGGNFKTKKYNWNKNLVMKSTIGWKKQSKESLNWRIGQYQWLSLNREKENWNFKINRASGTYRTIAKCLNTCIIRFPEGEEKEFPYIPCLHTCITPPCPHHIDILENIPYVLEKNVYFVAVGWHALNEFLSSTWSKVCFKSNISLLIFCLDDLPIIESGVLNSLLLLLYCCLFLPSDL